MPKRKSSEAWKSSPSCIRDSYGARRDWCVCVCMHWFRSCLPVPHTGKVYAHETSNATNSQKEPSAFGVSIFGVYIPTLFICNHRPRKNDCWPGKASCVNKDGGGASLYIRTSTSSACHGSMHSCVKVVIAKYASSSITLYLSPFYPPWETRLQKITPLGTNILTSIRIFHSLLDGMSTV